MTNEEAEVVRRIQVRGNRESEWIESRSEGRKEGRGNWGRGSREVRDREVGQMRVGEVGGNVE